MLTRYLDAPKAAHALMYLAKASRGAISYEKAAHLLYVAERTMACQHHQVLADMNLLAMRGGPVAGYALDRAARDGASPEDAFAWNGPAEELDQLSASDERALDSALMTYGGMDVADIRRQLRAGCPEWRMPLDPVEEISHRDLMMGLGLPRGEAEGVAAAMAAAATAASYFERTRS